MANPVCELCGLSEFAEHEAEYGELKDWSEPGSSRLMIHTGCLYWSHRVNFDEQTPAEDYIDCNSEEVSLLVSESREKKCVICSAYGASIVPHSTEVHGRPTSGLMVHFPCALRNGFTMQQGHPDAHYTYDNRRFAIPPPLWEPPDAGKIQISSFNGWPACEDLVDCKRHFSFDLDYVRKLFLYFKIDYQQT